MNLSPQQVGVESGEFNLGGQVSCTEGTMNFYPAPKCESLGSQRHFSSSSW